MKSGCYVTIIAIALLISMTVAPAAAVIISFEPPQSTIPAGSSAEITLVLDEAPAGLAGYDLEVVSADPGIAIVSTVSFPSWAQLTNISYPAEGAVRMSGVDTGRNIQAGSGKVVLGTISVSGRSAGSITLSIRNIHMNADGGAAMNASVGDAEITVGGMGTTGAPDAGGSSAGVTGDHLPLTAGAQDQGAGSPGPISLLGTGDQSDSPAGSSGNTVTHPVTAPSGGQEPAVSTSPAPVWVGPTGSPRSIPFSPIIGAVLATSLIAVGITLYFVKKGI